MIRQAAVKTASSADRQFTGCHKAVIEFVLNMA
jgi:hypothetical protein